MCRREGNSTVLAPNTPPPAPQPEYATLTDLHARFGVSRTVAYKLNKEGRLRLVKLGGRTLADLASVRALLADAPAVAA